jgi:hypothetical protein
MMKKGFVKLKPLSGELEGRCHIIGTMSKSHHMEQVVRSHMDSMWQ